MVKVGALAFDMLVGFSATGNGFPPARATFLASGNGFISFGDAPFAFPEVTRVLDDESMRRDQKHLQSHVYTRLTARHWQGLRWHGFTRNTDIPPVSLTANRDRLGRPLDGTRPSDRNAPDLAEDEESVIQACAIAELLVGERMVADSPLEAWESRLLPCLYPAEERLI